MRGCVSKDQQESIKVEFYTTLKFPFFLQRRFWFYSTRRPLSISLSLHVHPSDRPFGTMTCLSPTPPWSTCSTIEAFIFLNVIISLLSVSVFVWNFFLYFCCEKFVLKNVFASYLWDPLFNCQLCLYKICM